MIGAMIPYVGDAPTYTLEMDGSTYSKDDYPDLYDQVPDSWKSGDNFTLPDMSWRSAIGFDDTGSAVGETGGEQGHTLTLQEMPQHTHQYNQYTFGIDVESVGIPDPTGVGQPALAQTTTSAGGDQEHNNMPPYLSVKWGIYYQ